MTFLHVCPRGNKYIAKIIFKEGEGFKWATTTKAVHDWAKNHFNEGDEVDVEYENKNGQYFVSRISAPGSKPEEKSGTATKSEDNGKPKCEDCGKELKDGKYKKCYTCNKIGEKESKQEKPICKDCGKELKDNKYEKCYTCNQKNPTKTTSSDKSDAIARQNANHATSRALIALQGQIDTNNIYEISKTLHAHFLRLAKGETE